ncbi:unnamed protein product [Didymodactylos carnosus]|uniref:AB hydrolase-1 domain-containing protein n=1 Tax=Didymodactylos carnosus TaxID=1234261 RepID=A0A8S2N2J9_9BILA|nr:unnamed protein product [Didymodactylos carnosus]CAF3981471.1 unnamed protein product [Didymodactylos carnosus]
MFLLVLVSGRPGLLAGISDTTGFKDDSYFVYKVVDVLKEFIHALDLVSPLCLIGISYGGAIASLFTAKYPQYVNRLAILAAPAGETCETEVFQTVRDGFKIIIVVVLNALLSFDYPKLDDYYSTLKTIKCPTVILWGSEDKLFTCNGARYFHNLIPHAEVHIIPNCGHLMADEQPEQIATILTQFMGNKQE